MTTTISITIKTSELTLGKQKLPTAMTTISVSSDKETVHNLYLQKDSPMEALKILQAIFGEVCQ